MRYDKFFSADVPSFMRSPVREIFKKVDLSAIYSFAGGYPDAATFPIEDIRRISAQVLEKYGAKALQYGATQGVPELREVIARRYGDQSSKPGDDLDLGDELADVLWVVMCLANQTGIDLDAALERNFAKKTSRDKERHIHNEKLKH